MKKLTKSQTKWPAPFWRLSRRIVCLEIRMGTLLWLLTCIQAIGNGFSSLQANSFKTKFRSLIMVLLSIWKSGCAYLPLDHSFPGPRIEHIIRESRPVMVIYDEGKSLFCILITNYKNIYLYPELSLVGYA